MRTLALIIIIVVISYGQPTDSTATYKAGRINYRLNLSLSLLTTHFEDYYDYNEDQAYIGIQIRFKDGSPDSYVGVGTFVNSFEQQCIYLYGGHDFFFGSTPIYFKLTGGFIYGYIENYSSKLPINFNGIAPVIVPGFGVQYKMFYSEITLLGVAGVMWLVGISF